MQALQAMALKSQGMLLCFKLSQFCTSTFALLSAVTLLITMEFLIRQVVQAQTLTPEYLSFNIAPKLLAVAGTMTGLATLIFTGRVYVRARMLKVFGIDDSLMLIGVVLNIAIFAILVYGTQKGLGRHFFAIPPENIAPMSIAIFQQGLLITFAVYIVKLSIAFFLLRLAQRTRYKNFLYGVIGFLILMIIACFWPLFRCKPMAASWNIALQPPPWGTGNAKCMSLNTSQSIGVGFTCINIITDVVFAVLPIPMIWNLQINTRTKISLAAVLSLGIFACAAAIFKAPLQYNYSTNTDATGQGSWLWVVQIIELALGIIAGSLPSLKPLFNWCLETVRSITTRSPARTGMQSSYSKRHDSGLGYFKTVASKLRGEGDGDRIELQSVGDSEAAESADASNDKAKGLYSVKISGKAWDIEKGKSSQEAILPHEEEGNASSSGIEVTTKVSMS